MTIRLDRSASTTLVLCTSCAWRSLTAATASDVRAWRVGADHERSCHPGSQAATSNLVKATRRANVIGS